MSAATTSAVLGRRTCAVLAAGSAGLHGFMAAHAGTLAAAVLIVAMACACLYCAWELWSHGTLRSWCVVAVMNLGMVAAHMSLPQHDHGGLGHVAAGPSSTLMTVATTVAVVEAVVAAAVMWRRTRGIEGRLVLERSDQPSLPRGAW
jgi:hypothetical protein